MASVFLDLPPHHFDCIIADPPYVLNSETDFDDAAKLQHSYEDSLDAALAVAECEFRIRAYPIREGWDRATYGPLRNVMSHTSRLVGH